jgi:hypothetical protein
MRIETWWDKFVSRATTIPSIIRTALEKKAAVMAVPFKPLCYMPEERLTMAVIEQITSISMKTSPIPISP